MKKPGRIKKLIQNVMKRLVADPIQKEREKIQEEVNDQKFIRNHPETRKGLALKKLKERYFKEAEKWGISREEFESLIIGSIVVGESPQWLVDYFEEKRYLINQYTLSPSQDFDADYQKIRGQRIRRFIE